MNFHGFFTAGDVFGALCTGATLLAPPRAAVLGALQEWHFHSVSGLSLKSSEFLDIIPDIVRYCEICFIAIIYF